MSPLLYFNNFEDGDITANKYKWSGPPGLLLYSFFWEVWIYNIHIQAIAHNTLPINYANDLISNFPICMRLNVQI